MLKTFFLSASRTLRKNRWHSVINIVGLTLGISCAIVIFSIIRFELSFDNYHHDGERTYRIVTELNRFGEINFTAGITYPLPDALRRDFPDLAYVTITDTNLETPILSIINADGSKKLFKESKFAFADPDYFKIFTYQWIEGSPEKALTAEKGVVVTETIAKKYFGDRPAMGQVIWFNSMFLMTVTGVVKDPPPNSDLQYKLIFSNKLGADGHAWTAWGPTSSGINCYVQLKDHVNAGDFESKLKGWHLKFFTGDSQEKAEAMTYFLQPLREVHFDTRFNTSNERVVATKTLVALALIGALLLITACINFVNLNTVLIINRSKEVGVKKALGAGKVHLIITFLAETFLVVSISLLLSLGAVQLFVGFLKSLMSYIIVINFFTDFTLVAFVLVLLVLVTILAGLYPAMMLAAFKPVRALKNRQYDSTDDGISLRRMLIGFQLITSQTLVICTIIVVQQLKFISEWPMGLNSSSVVEFKLPPIKSTDLKLLKERFRAIPGVENVAMSNTGAAGNDSWSSDFEAKVSGHVVNGLAEVKFADNDYVRTYQLTLLAGKDLIASDSTTMFLINEAAVRTMGFSSAEEAVGTQLKIWGEKELIAGVVKDYNTTSLRDLIRPVIIMSQRNFYSRTAVRLATNDITGAVDKIHQIWKSTYPDYIFEYEFLDDTIQRFYDSERQTSNLIRVASGIAILIGAIGLLGLVSFSVSRRTKEIGIRKTLGASITSLVALFSREFVLLVIFSFCFAAPVAHLLMNQWLSNFAYHIHPGVGSFAAGLMLSAIVVLGTVGFMSYRAAISNPVESLKYD